MSPATSAAGAVETWFQRQLATWAMLFKREDIALERWHRVRALRPADPTVPATIAHLMAQRGDRPGAIEWLERSLELDANRAATWFNLGFLQQELGEHEQALVSFDRAIALDDKLDRGWYGKAISLIKLGRVAEAIPLLKRNTELQPMSPYGWYQLAHAYHRLGDPDRVAGVIRKLSQFEPKVAEQLQRETGVQAGVKAPY